MTDHNDLTEFLNELLRVYPPPQLFAVVTWGCAATSWLAKVLNSHPDIYCVHAANWFWSNFGGAPRLDGVPYLRLIGSQGYAHVAAGDVHGVSRENIPALRKTFGEQFNCVVVVREPLARLRSQLALFERFERFEAWEISYVNAVIDNAGLHLPANDYAHRLFVHGVNMLNAIVEEQMVGTLYRSEDLTTDPGKLGQLVAELTRDKISPDSSWLHAAVASPPANPHAHTGALPHWSDWQLEVFRKVIRPLTWELYSRIGYSPPFFV